MADSGQPEAAESHESRRKVIPQQSEGCRVNIAKQSVGAIECQLVCSGRLLGYKLCVHANDAPYQVPVLMMPYPIAHHNASASVPYPTLLSAL